MYYLVVLFCLFGHFFGKSRKGPRRPRENDARCEMLLRNSILKIFVTSERGVRKNDGSCCCLLCVPKKTTVLLVENCLLVAVAPSKLTALTEPIAGGWRQAAGRAPAHRPCILNLGRRSASFCNFGENRSECRTERKHSSPHKAGKSARVRYFFNLFSLCSLCRYLKDVLLIVCTARL